jgi:hypothetical protein
MLCISPMRGCVLSNSTDGFIYIDNNIVGLPCLRFYGALPQPENLNGSEDKHLSNVC